MQTKFIRIRELASSPGRNGLPARRGRLPVSFATIWRWVKLGAFPKPVRLGPQVTAWRMEDIERWEAEHGARLSVEADPHAPPEVSQRHGSFCRYRRQG